MLPVAMGRQNFEKEGDLRTFTLRVKGEDETMRERTYKFNPPIVRRVLVPGEDPPHRKATRARRKTAR